MKYTKNVFLTLIIVTCSAFGFTAQKQAQNEPPVITIFVHGTKPPIPDVLFKTAKYFFLPNLHHVDQQCNHHGPKDIIKGLQDSGYVDPTHLYFFGWSGKLCSKDRRRAAHTLMDQIEKLMTHYVDIHHVTPILHIITHSHGGNVALNLVHALEQKGSDIVVDELILLAPPVQSWTNEYIKSNNCKKIYNIFSMGDIIQAADPQGIQIHVNRDEVAQKPHILKQSDRTFDHHEKVTQIQTEIDTKDPGHLTFIDFVYPPILRTLFPHHFPRFLPELGRIMHKAKSDDVQKYIQTTKKPITIKINTYQAPDSNRVAVYL